MWPIKDEIHTGAIHVKNPILQNLMPATDFNLPTPNPSDPNDNQP